MPISVVIPTWNRATVLGRALASVAAQSLAPVEIIVVDDGSRDQTASVVRSDFPTVTYYYQDHAGVSAARNHGIRRARSPWIAFLDSDDAWAPNKLERQMRALEQNPRYRIVHTDEIWIRDGHRINQKQKHRKSGGWIFDQCLPLCAISPSSVLIDAAVFPRWGYFDEDLPACEDYDMWLRICARTPVLYVDEPLVTKYGGHADQLSRRIWGLDRFRIRALQKLLDSGVLDDGQRPAARDMLLNKLDIYINGAHKRERWDEVARYETVRAGLGV